jgi:hypothetical protein
MNAEEIVKASNANDYQSPLPSKEASRLQVIASYNCIQCNKMYFADNMFLQAQANLSKRKGEEFKPTCPQCGNALVGSKTVPQLNPRDKTLYANQSEKNVDLAKKGSYNTFMDRLLVSKAMDALQKYASKQGMLMPVARYKNAEHKKQAGQEYPTLNNFDFEIEFYTGPKTKQRVFASISFDQAGQFKLPRIFKDASGKEYPFEKEYVDAIVKKGEFERVEPDARKKSDQLKYRPQDPSNFHMSSLQHKATQAYVNYKDTPNACINIQAGEGNCEIIVCKVFEDGDSETQNVWRKPCPLEGSASDDEVLRWVNRNMQEELSSAEELFNSLTNSPTSSLQHKAYQPPVNNPNAPTAPNTQQYQPNQQIVNPIDGKTYQVKNTTVGKGMSVVDPRTQQESIIPENQIQNVKPALNTTAGMAEKLANEILNPEMVEQFEDQGEPELPAEFQNTPNVPVMTSQKPHRNPDIANMSRGWKTVRESLMKTAELKKQNEMMNVPIENMSREARAMKDIGYSPQEPDLGETGHDKVNNLPFAESKEIEVGLTEFPYDQKKEDSNGYPTDEKKQKGYRQDFKEMEDEQVKNREHFHNEELLHRPRMKDLKNVEIEKDKNYGLNELESSMLSKAMGMVHTAEDVSTTPPDNPASPTLEVRDVAYKPYKKSPPNYDEPSVIDEAGGGVSEMITKFKQVQTNIDSIQKQIVEKQKPLQEKMETETKELNESLAKEKELATKYLNLLYNRLDTVKDRVTWYENSIVGNMDVQSLKTSPASVAQIIEKTKQIAPEILESLMKVKAFIENESTKEVLDRFVVEYPISKSQEPKLRKASIDDSMTNWLLEATDVLSELDSILKDLQ